MEDIFITNIHINKVRHLENVDILLSETERKHLILTGKNGSGKTSVLQSINEKLYLVYLSDLQYVKNNKSKNDTIEDIIQFHPKTDENNDIKLNFSSAKLLPKYVTQKEFVFLCLSAKRKSEFSQPDSIRKIDISSYFHNHDKANRIFIDYLVNLRAERSFAIEEKNLQKASVIDAWFLKFENALKDIFQEPRLSLEFVRDNFKYNFNIIIPNREPFDFQTLSDGYSSVLDIISEIMIRMENKASQSYDLQGIVLIDEIETHLHIDLQKKILPFLTSFFPKIQFIVTTHSPFVLSSVDNAVIFDLEKQERVEDLSKYSLDAIVKGYFDSNNYSETMMQELREYENLLKSNSLTVEQKMRKNQLRASFDSLPTFLAPEIQLKLNQLKLAELELIHD